jgi:hypothetical protein
MTASCDAPITRPVEGCGKHSSSRPRAAQSIVRKNCSPARSARRFSANSSRRDRLVSQRREGTSHHLISHVVLCGMSIAV